MAAGKQKTRLKVGDTVIVTSGAHKGDTGSIKRFTSDRARVFVEGVNMVRRHEKPMPALGRNGGIIDKEAPIHVSNVSLLGADGKPTRIGYRKLDSGEKVRISKRTGDAL